MTLWVCTACTAAYAVGLKECPQCGSAQYVEEGQQVPKITAHEGPSIAGVTGAWSDNDGPDPWPAQAEDEADGGEPRSATSSSSESSETPSTESETNGPETPSRARTTGSRSGKGRTASSTARGTGGGRTARTSQTGSDPND